MKNKRQIRRTTTTTHKTKLYASHHTTRGINATFKHVCMVHVYTSLALQLRLAFGVFSSEKPPYDLLVQSQRDSASHLPILDRIFLTFPSKRRVYLFKQFQFFLRTIPSATKSREYLFIIVSSAPSVQSRPDLALHFPTSQSSSFVVIVKFETDFLHICSSASE